MYGRVHGRVFLLIGINVYNLVITRSDTRLDHDEITRFKEEMKTEFLIGDLELISFYLGLSYTEGKDGAL